MCEREQTLRNCAQACMLLDDMQFISLLDREAKYDVKLLVF